MEENKSTANRLRIIYILDFFNKFSDENHPVNCKDISNYLAQFNVRATRKTIYADINALRDFGIDICNSVSKNDGYFLGYRDFDLAQVHTLCNAVASAQFISQKKSSELIGQISNLASTYEKKSIINLTSLSSRAKSKDDSIFFVVDTINKAIEKKQKISFEYHKYNIIDNRPVLQKNKDFVISPYALAWCNDNYYLVGNYEKYQNLSNYRVDRIKKVFISKDTARDFSEVSDYKDKFDISDYISKNTMMFSGVDTKIELLCSNSMLDIIIDKFGTDCEIINKAKGRFLMRTNVYYSDGLVNWLLPYCKNIYVEKPIELREKLIEKSNEISSSFTNSILKLL